MEGESAFFGEIAENAVHEIHAKPRAAEILHQILEGGLRGVAVKNIAGISGGTKLVVLFSLVNVTKDAVSFIDFLEFFIRPFFFTGVFIRMELHREFAVSLFDVIIGGCSGYT